MTASSSPHVLIAGAGLGGLALAQALRKQGISYEIFERDENQRERRPGWVIGLHGMLDDLKQSIPDDLPPVSSLSNLLPLTKYQPEVVYYNPETPNQPKIGVRGDESGWIVRAARHKIVEWLETHIPVQYSKKIENIVETGDKVKIYFQDGTSAEGDILVGAEGSRSVTRKHILGHDPIRTPPVGFIDGYCTLKGDEIEEQLRLGHSLYIVDMDSINGAPMIFLVTLIEMNPDGESGKIGWALIWPDEGATEKDFWTYKATGQELYDFVVSKTKDLPVKYLTTLKRSDPQSTLPVLRLYTLVIDSMPTGRVTLLGDAAHAMTPFRGEGGYHAISDALNLAKAISKIDKDNIESIKEVFDPYQAKMLERGREAAKLSEEAFSKKREVGSTEFYYAWGRRMSPLPEED
ncbi:putative monooxygenase [Xylaria bambusicola]|uniref:putative monooxygenase n=1 Tax=Xylaria bambusicola TaxID=326684 RepID=UPI002008588D|nr:putative monooxygenase [Xylaria bambusicola]KAI0506468.1 putative monooxygenase [Xylaria bambusicola]